MPSIALAVSYMHIFGVGPNTISVFDPLSGVIKRRFEASADVVAFGLNYAL